MPIATGLALGRPAELSDAQAYKALRSLEVDAVLVASGQTRCRAALRILRTAGQVRERFDRYKSWPHRAALLSSRQNPEGFAEERESLLQCDTADAQRLYLDEFGVSFAACWLVVVGCFPACFVRFVWFVVDCFSPFVAFVVLVRSSQFLALLFFFSFIHFFSLYGRNSRGFLATSCTVSPGLSAC